MHCSDQSLPSQALDSSEAEEHDKESRPSQDVVPSYKSSEFDRERLLNYRQLLERMPMSTQQISNQTEDQLNDRKILEEHVQILTRHRIIHSLPSQQQESYDQRNSSRSGEMAERWTADEETVSKSDHSSTGYTRADGQRPYDPFSPTEPQFYRSYQSQACDIGQYDRRHSYSQNTTEYTLPSVNVETGRKWSVYDHVSSSSAPQRNDRKTLEEHTQSPTHYRIIHSPPSQLQESYDRTHSSRSGEMAERWTADEETVSKSGLIWTGYTRDGSRHTYDPLSSAQPQFYRSYQSQSQADDIGQDDRRHSYSQNMTEHTLPSVSVETGRKWSVYDHVSSSSAPQRNDRRILEEHVESPTHHRIIQSPPSRLQESYDRRNSSRSGENDERFTADEESVSKSGHSWTSYTRDDGQCPYDPFSPTEPQFYRSYQSQSQAGDIGQDDRRHSYSQNMTEYTLPSVSVGTGRKWTVYDHASSSSAPQPQQSYQPRHTDAGDFNSELSLSREVNWLDSWTSATNDTDPRNYRRHY